MASKRLTVLQVLPALESGGVEKGTLEIAEALVQAGHRSIVMSAGGRLVETLIKQGSEHVQWPIGVKSLKTLLLVRKLRKFLRDEKIDVVHARSRVPAWIVYLAWKKMQVNNRPKFVTTVHGFYSESWYSAIMTKGEVVIAVSESIRDYIKNNYPKTDMSRVKVIYRGIDPEEYPYGYKPSQEWLDKWDRDFPNLKDKKIITLPGRITRLKGHEDFIQIMEELSKERDDVVGVIAGGYEEKKKDYYKEIVNLVKAKGLTEKIIFVGHRSDMREVLAASNVVLSLTQKPESFGRTTLEALSMGVPVCGYDHGGVGEQLREIFSQGRIMKFENSGARECIKSSIDKTEEVLQNKKFKKNIMQISTLNLYIEKANK
jgi:glycosyltransferase involved in cell wall biosynthesis